MLVGIIGAPNKGKSTIFSAMTMASADIADYPFTTIKPNRGVAYAVRDCVEKELHTKCNPRNSLCIDGKRMIPVEIVDVAGLVPGAHLGKGMGNQFLGDLSSANVLIEVIDASMKTDANGNKAENSDPYEEVKMVEDELALWFADIIMRHMPKLSKSQDGANSLHEVLSGFSVSNDDIKRAAEAWSLPLSKMNWKAEDSTKFARELLKRSKPIIVAANKIDKTDEDRIKRTRDSLKDYDVIECSGMVELTLRKAAKDGKIHYVPGSRDFQILTKLDSNQENALNYIKSFLSKRSTGISELINEAVFKREDNIVVYPVEDESKYTDHFGNVLPTALILKSGSTSMDLAMRIHTELGKNMLYAVDVKKKMRVAKDYKLRDNDVIKIVSAAK